MVAFMHEAIDCNNPKTLCEWVKNFRMKKVQMKRKLRGNLRVNAILSMALVSAEHELRRKQHERFNRWLAMQSQLEGKVGSHEQGLSRVQISDEEEEEPQSAALAMAEEQQNQFKCNEPTSSESSSSLLSSCASECRRREAEISNLWKCELSGLDQFMRNISGSSNSTSSSSSRSHHQPATTTICS